MTASTSEGPSTRPAGACWEAWPCRPRRGRERLFVLGRVDFDVTDGAQELDQRRPGLRADPPAGSPRELTAGCEPESAGRAAPPSSSSCSSSLALASGPCFAGSPPPASAASPLLAPPRPRGPGGPAQGRRRRQGPAGSGVEALKAIFLPRRRQERRRQRRRGGGGAGGPRRGGGGCCCLRLLCE